jgi:oxygen-independent coproporphyrinogen III oxidase
MAGIYVHIPFCKQLCYYCDFHFSVSFKLKDRVINAICKELADRKDEYNKIAFDTIYFGGGTPSSLSVQEIVRILDAIYKNYLVSEKPEITIEVNPDDLTASYLQDLKNFSPFNRLSIGVQSFHDKDLWLMNRRHSAKEAIESILRSKKAGFENINIDLIYGLPAMNDNLWHDNLDQFLKLEIPHLSAYHLTFETKTVFSHYLKKGKILPLSEELSISQFETLIRFMEDNGYDHYEISNFAKENRYSRHNLGYWTGKPYLGIGPSAHSYFNESRRWNVSINEKYCVSLENNSDDYYESEILDTRTAYNDYLLTSLRTRWGVDKEWVMMKFGNDYLNSLNESSEKFILNGTMLQEGQKLILNKKGMLIADYIISEMMIIEP